MIPKPRGPHVWRAWWLVGFMDVRQCESGTFFHANVAVKPEFSDEEISFGVKSYWAGLLTSCIF